MSLQFKRTGPPLAAMLITLLAWEMLVANSAANFQLVPAPSQIIVALGENAERLISLHIPTTLAEAGIGTVLALVAGVALAALLDAFSLLRRAIYPLLVVSQTIPIVAIAPVLIIIFGFEMAPKIAVVALFGFFPIAVATLDGLTSTEPDLIALLRSMGANRWQIWRKVRLPSAMPSLFSGLRIAATYAVGSAILGEFVTARAGLGQVIRSGFQQSQSDLVFGVAAISALLSIAFVSLVALIERLTLRWYYTESRDSSWQR
ncbi:MAG: ABC transporter permease [Anaerolineae bacterium]